MSNSPAVRSFLLAVPVEILNQIIFFTRPDGFESFVLSCQKMYKIAVADDLIADHNHLKRKWSDWGFHADSHPLELLRAIIRRPIIASYLKRVEFGPARIHRSNEFYDVIHLKACRDELRRNQALLSMLQACPYLREAQQNAEEWHSKILGDSIDIDFAWVFLSTLLSNLTSLSLRPRWRPTKYDPDNRNLLLVLRAIYQKCSGGCQMESVLSRLSAIEANSSGDLSEMHLAELASFLALPSARQFTGTLLQSNVGRHNTQWSWEGVASEGWKSSLEVIELISCSVCAVHMKDFLTPMYRLRRLKYHYSRRASRWSWITLDGGFIVSMLKDLPLTETLEELSLKIPNDMLSATALRSLQALKRLKYLAMDLDMLFYPQKNDWIDSGGTCSVQGHTNWAITQGYVDGDKYGVIEDHRVPAIQLVDILLASIRAVTLASPRDGMIDVPKILCNLPSEVARVPNLRMISVFSKRLPQNVAADGRHSPLADALNVLGIQLKWSDRLL